MRIWGKKDERLPASRSITRAAVAGASRAELVREALLMLADSGHVDRVGVWIQSDLPGAAEPCGHASFRGQVWERDSAATPAEWGRLSSEAPLPFDVLARGKSVELALDGRGVPPLIGPLVGMRRALWVPIIGGGQLQGLLLAAARSGKGALPRLLAENAAADLALALVNMEEQRVARERQVDLSVLRRTLAALGANESPENILAQLAENCTGGEPFGMKPGVVFAVIGRIQAPAGAASGPPQIAFDWKSGDPAWTRGIAGEPLANTWRRALELRQVVGMEPPSAWSPGEVARVVAIPLESGTEIAGILVAGLPRQAVSLAILERLELRAMLAGSALGQQRRAEEDAKRNQRQGVLLNISREAVVLLDAQGQLAGLNSGASKLLGEQRAMRDARPGGARFGELFVEQERERVETWSRELLSSGAGPGEASIRAELENGTCIRLCPAATGRGFAAVRMEPLQTLELPQQPGRAETELLAVLEWLEEGVVLFDAEERVRAMNSRFAQMAGLTAEESGDLTTLSALIARLSEQFAEPEEFAQSWRKLARAGGGEREELHMALPVPRVLERASRPILDEAGERLGRVEIYRDITAQRVFQSKLLQTEKLAALGQMVSGLAHELSNPLTTILGSAQRLLVSADAVGRTSEVRQIFQEADRAGKILRQLLLSSRDSRPERQRVSLNKIVLRATELQRFQKNSHTIHMEQQLDPLLPYIRGDAGQLQQVLINLVGNAQQALEHSGREGVIRVTTKRLAGRRVLLEVSDDGPGIPQAILPRIFDPFFTTKPEGVGTGLGLAVVLSVVREHGGQVSVASPPGGGTTFSIELPAAQIALPASGSELPARREVLRSQRLSPARRRSDCFAARVLVVEDEPTVARLIADVLEDEGLRVDVVLDGREALGRAASESYDLTICDMKMPGIDGQHFFRALARTRNPLRERLLFVTGDVISPHTHEFLERNHLPHVAKPFRVEELIEAVRQLLAGKAAPPEVQAKKQLAQNG
jgi:signal transduction histidine kinase/ActR/RegA family two-component response regulator